jgi:hypothetical protein
MFFVEDGADSIAVELVTADVGGGNFGVVTETHHPTSPRRKRGFA